MIGYVTKAAAFAAGLRVGFNPDPHRKVYEQLIRSLAWHGFKEELERDSTKLQPIPYVVVRRYKGMFIAERLEAGTEDRLHGYLSVAFGGHVEAEHELECDDPFEAAARRELNEELLIMERLDEPDLFYHGTLYDPSTDVGRHHIGLIFSHRVSEAKVADAEKDKLKGQWVTELDLHRMLHHAPDRFESWSKIIINNLGRMATIRSQEK